jgi:hypothetical protein
MNNLYHLVVLDREPKTLQLKAIFNNSIAIVAIIHKITPLVLPEAFTVGDHA